MLLQVRCWCAGAWISMTSLIYTMQLPNVHSGPISAKFDLLLTFRKLTTAEVGEYLYLHFVWCYVQTVGPVAQSV
jgi:hypothetical protein